MQQTTSEHSSDVMYLVRTSGVSPANYSIARSLVAQQIRQTIVTVESADVLTLFSTPVQIVAGVAGKFIIPDRIILVLDSGASTNYATNTQAIFGTESLISTTNFTVTGGLPTMTGGSIAFPGYSNLGQVTSMVAGDGLFMSVKTGNPTTGDGDVTLVVQYILLDA